jgi:hypothetical protein
MPSDQMICCMRANINSKNNVVSDELMTSQRFPLHAGIRGFYCGAFTSELVILLSFVFEVNLAKN